MDKLILYIKKYGVIIFVLIFSFLASSSINPYIKGDFFEKKNVNKDYRIEKGIVTSEVLGEISGLSYSSMNKLFWLHNDSGNASDIYAIDEDGKIKMTIELDGVKNIDFEDIALTSYEGKNNIYIGDIGDNDFGRSEMFIYKIPEPFISKNNSEDKFKIVPDVMNLDVSDLHVNFEAMMVENKSGKIFLIEKVKSKKARIFIISKFENSNDYYVPIYYGEIDFEIYGKQEIVACDISKDDKYILIKSKENVFMLDHSNFENKITSDMLKQMPYVEEYRGEAISWSENSLGYYTISENEPNKPLNLYYYRNVYK